jgi:hypothetical protein
MLKQREFRSETHPGMIDLDQERHAWLTAYS